VVSVSLSLDNQSSSTSWNKLLKNCSEFFRNLLESSLDSLIFTLIEDFDELLDGLLRRLQLLTALGKCVPLLGEVVVLLKSLFVDMTVLFQAFVYLMEFLNNLEGVSTLSVR
jgi:hypothetical protein